MYKSYFEELKPLSFPWSNDSKVEINANENKFQRKLNSLDMHKTQNPRCKSFPVENLENVQSLSANFQKHLNFLKNHYNTSA
ncbi:hypothetical protein SAMN03097699_0643 [Flavobacteriaceae bacterium MAR_2010_188]|nr:hypothetical protein SAMN03097699_0643 [Flavobacteriaceae bacterium MAR_2010_188]